MRQEIKTQRALQKALALLQQHGSTETATEAKKFAQDPNAVKEMARLARTQRAAPSYEAEAVLMFLLKPARFDAKKCRRCGRAFMTNYRGVGYCSDRCRELDLAAQGIQWDPTKVPERRWGSNQYPVEPPMMFGPQVLKVLVELASQQEKYPELFRTWSEASKPETEFSEHTASLEASLTELDQQLELTIGDVDAVADPEDEIAATSFPELPDLEFPELDF